MKWLDLFSGIGMYAVGLEQAGHEVIGFCEKETWAQKILKKHWPMKPISSCIKSLNKRLEALSLDFPARTSALPIRMEPPLAELEADSSGSLLKPFAWWHSATSSWRTWEPCLQNEGEVPWELFSVNWPASGMILNGIAYQRKPLAHPISAQGRSFLPTLGAQEGKGSSQKRYRGSPSFRGAKMSEGLRTCLTDPIYTHPNFAEAVFGLPKDYTELETEIRPASSANLQGA